MKRFISLLLVISLLVSMQMSLAFAENVSTESGMASPAYYFSGDLRKAGQLKIQVQIWGHVRKPGLYIVPDDTDLLSLISLAGGPTESARLGDVKLIRVQKPDTVLVVDIKRFMETANAQPIPKLKPKDTVMVPGSAIYGFGRIVGFISQIATIATAYMVIARVTK